MYNAPPELPVRVFAKVPDALRMRGEKSAWAFGKDHSEMHSFLEGPSFDRAGNLYVVDIPYGRILRITPAGEFTQVARYDGWPNGLKIHQDGRIFVADHLRGILVVDPASGTVKPVLERVRREGLKGVNDMVFASNGDLYFTDQGQTGLQDPTGRVYRLKPDGHVDLLIDTIPSPNGIVLTPDEKFLLVAVTRANQIWRMPLHADGSTSKVAAFIQLSGGLAGPDGLAMDAQGNLAIAHCGLGTVWLFSRLGEPLYRMRSPAGLATTNLAYGGPGNKHLYITESDSGSILVAEMPTPGMTLYSHR